MHPFIYPFSGPRTSERLFPVFPLGAVLRGHSFTSLLGREHKSFSQPYAGVWRLGAVCRLLHPLRTPLIFLLTHFLLFPLPSVFCLPEALMSAAPSLLLGLVWTRLPPSRGGKRGLPCSSWTARTSWLPRGPCSQPAAVLVCSVFQAHPRRSVGSSRQGRQSNPMPSPLCPLAILSRQEISWKLRVADRQHRWGTLDTQWGSMREFWWSSLSWTDHLNHVSCTVQRTPSVSDDMEIIIVIVIDNNNNDNDSSKLQCSSSYKPLLFYVLYCMNFSFLQQPCEAGTTSISLYLPKKWGSERVVSCPRPHGVWGEGPRFHLALSLHNLCSPWLLCIAPRALLTKPTCLFTFLETKGMQRSLCSRNLEFYLKPANNPRPASGVKWSLQRQNSFSRRRRPLSLAVRWWLWRRSGWGLSRWVPTRFLLHCPCPERSKSLMEEEPPVPGMPAPGWGWPLMTWVLFPLTPWVLRGVPSPLRICREGAGLKPPGAFLPRVSGSSFHLGKEMEVVAPSAWGRFPEHSSPMIAK